MRMSQQLVATRREAPADVVVPSHALLLRAGMLFPVAAGVFAHGTPLVRVLRRVEEVVRTEMDRIGGQEVRMPSLLPRELWEDGRRDHGGQLRPRSRGVRPDLRAVRPRPREGAGRHGRDGRWQRNESSA